MKIVVIGDIHGRDIRKKIVEQETADKYIFLGDYFDSFDVDIDKQYSNFNDILDSGHIMLLGNHDFHYLPFVDDVYSGFKAATKMLAGQLILKHVGSGRIHICHQEGGYLFTHAGVSKFFSEGNIKSPIDIKKLRAREPHTFGFDSRDLSGYGNNPRQGPLRIRPTALRGNTLEGYTHVVGHTQVDNIEIGEDIILCDCLANGQYLIIEDNTPRVGYVK